MDEIIEEAAKEATRKEYLCESCAYKGDCDLCGGQNTAFDCCECPADSYEDGFKAGASHILSLPLSQRLTDEEKKRVRIAYNAMSEYGKSKSSECCSCANFAAKVWAERIFGKDFFRDPPAK